MTTIDATVAGTNSNSYITLTEADAYWADHLYSTTWDALTDDNKNKALVMATRYLDDWVDWKGIKASDNQSLRWPRYDVVDRDNYWIDGDVIPPFLKDATAELAGYVAIADPTAEPDTKGFSELKVGELMLKIDKDDRDSTTAIPDSVKAIISHYGSIRDRTGPKIVKLVRT